MDRESILAQDYPSDFDELCKNRIVLSRYKYGPVKDNYPLLVDAIENARARIEKYEGTGNKEYLLDAANFLRFEWMYPRHPDAHFTPTDEEDMVIGDPVGQWGGAI